MVQAFFSAGSKLSIRALNRYHEPLVEVIFSMALVCTVGAAVGCAAVPGAMRLPLDGHTGGYLAGVSGLGAIVQVGCGRGSRWGCASPPLRVLATTCAPRPRLPRAPRHQVTFTYALQKANAASAAALDYTSLIWSLLADLIVFRHSPSHLSLFGAAVICASSVLTLALSH